MKNICFVLTAILFSCKAQTPVVLIEPAITPPASSADVKWYMTLPDESLKNSLYSKVTAWKTEEAQGTDIVIDSTLTYQSIDGFGAALTGSSAFLLHQKIQGNAKQDLYNKLFNPKTGAAVSYLRLTMGASDFTPYGDYTYADQKGKDGDLLSNFTLSKDTLDILPVLKEILKISPKIKILASPWSPPSWMKTNGKLAGGSLKPEFYEAYAAYFVKYLKAMQSHGVEIDAITPQNEPLHDHAKYPCMLMTPAEQAAFVKVLGKALEQANFKTKIIVYDHNCDKPEYPIEILQDKEALKYVNGSAFHLYAGDISAMSKVHDAFPQKDLYFTEISGGEWATNYKGNLHWNVKNLAIGATQNYSKNVLFWNLALDPKFGPQNNGCDNCRGVVTVANGDFKTNVEYDVLTHLKHVRPGSVRIKSTTSASVKQVAFLNPDGKKVLLVLNEKDQEQAMGIFMNHKRLSITLPAGSVSTIVW